MESSLYIHIPYCASKCIYCDFFSGGAKYADWDRLCNQLLSELSARYHELSSDISTIYLGGGTPSLIPEDVLYYFIKGMRSILDESLRNNAEFTIEVNPEDVSAGLIDMWCDIGVNRVSIGIQSFDDSLLSLIGRKHSGQRALEALDAISRRFQNVSGDIIFGLPNQSFSQFKDDVEILINSGVSHISCYSLMVEEGTALHQLILQRKISPADEGLSEKMYEYLIERLNEAGFEHYEISNFARPGFRSQHNSGYWKGQQYLGIGPAAHSYDGLRTRRSNPWNLKGYLKHDFSTASFYEEEYLTDIELREEMIMLSLRTKEGLDLDNYERRFGAFNKERILQSAKKDLDCGKLILTDHRLQLSESGILTADNTISNLF